MQAGETADSEGIVTTSGRLSRGGVTISAALSAQASVTGESATVPVAPPPARAPEGPVNGRPRGQHLR
jgi:hypothetical protein